MMPNCIVHVIMYIYYLCACLGPKMQKIVAPWKKYVTRLQLVCSYFTSVYIRYIVLYDVPIFSHRCFKIIRFSHSI